ncbi:hypothetical protein [Rhodobacter sp. TJ_12]|uniref:hypothetical protein n=1 Tax=Rhodobacter sp. TJ_12 TaxID=2029399 RepID=UPI001CBAC013|nr:hypothetical protein [Rhodobacter sp. TJ_12]
MTPKFSAVAAIFLFGVLSAAPAVPFQGDAAGALAVTTLDGRQMLADDLTCLDLQVHAQIEGEWARSFAGQTLPEPGQGRAPVQGFGQLYQERCGV